MLGVMIARELLHLDALRDASLEQITELLRPGFDPLASLTLAPSSPESNAETSRAHA